MINSIISFLVVLLFWSYYFLHYLWCIHLSWRWFL